MLKRVSAIWLLIALVAMVVAYWAGRQGGRPQSPDGAPRAGAVAAPAKPTTSTQPATASPVAAAPSTSLTTTPYDTGGEAPAPYEEPPGYDYGTDESAGEPTKPWSGDTGYEPGRPAAPSTPDSSTTSDWWSRGSTTSTQETPALEAPAQEQAAAFAVFDGFENGSSWAVESAADHAVLAIADERVSEGQKALKATWKAFGKGNFELRREVKLDLTDATALRLDVYNEGGPLDLVLGMRAGYDATLFTTPPKPLENGWNKDVSFRLADLSFAEKGPWGTSWTWSRDNVNRMSLIFREREEKEGAVHVDNLRFDRPAEKIGAKARPVIKTITASARTIERYETVELALAFDATYQNFFDRAEVDLSACFFAPSGKRHEVKGFVLGIDDATAKPSWAIRFTPNEVGLWRYDVTVKDGGGQTTSQTYELLCRAPADAAGARRGFIRVSKADSLCFEFDNGDFYYPLGQNVCWASNYEYYLDQIKAYGGNYIRIWLCPWNLQLEDPKEPGKYDLRTAQALDALLEQCRARGIYVQLVLRYHGIQDATWDKNPYNSANGGPCTWAADFFTDGRAKDLHKRFLEYVAARWGHSPTIFAWELWNEADLARCDRESDLVAWHRDMAGHLKKVDPHGHLVTTSVASPGRHTALFELPEIDFVPIHLYTRDLAKQYQDAYLLYRKLRKPMFVGEFSAGIKPSDDLDDAGGVHLHAGLWLAFTTPFAGNAMPWWWDTFVDKNKLYPHWSALARFAAGVDRRGKNYELISSQVRLSNEATVSLRGLVAPSEAFLWVYDEARIAQPQHAERPLLFAEHTIRLHGMLGGKFRVEVWDTTEGRALSETLASSDDGTVSIVLPKSSRDLAVRVTRETAAKALPRLEW